jgi:phosphonate transport system substrate-binding protein
MEILADNEHLLRSIKRILIQRSACVMAPLCKKACMFPKTDRLKTGRLSQITGFRVLLGAVFFSLLSGCGQVRRADYLPRIDPTPFVRPARVEYSFGVLPLHNAVQLFETYQPLIDEINSHVSGFILKLETARDYPNYEAKVRDRKLHFAMLNAHLIIPGEDHGYQIIARAGDMVRGLIVIPTGSNIRRIRDLKSASISFGARTDLPGTMMPKAFLRQYGLDVDKQTKPKYVGSQESALMNVYFGLSAAACVSDSTWNTFKRARPEVAQSLHVRWETEPLVGLGILARDDAPPEHVGEVANALFELNASAGGREILKVIRVSGFKPASSGTYDAVWEFLNGYRKRFGRTPALGDAE